MSGIRFGNVVNLLVFAVIMCTQTSAARGARFGAHSSDGILPNDHVSTMKVETNQSSALAPTVTNLMTKPCVLYEIAYERTLDETTGTYSQDESDWFCEIDAEDRVSY